MWRPVVGYESSYEVSDRGRVRSVDRIVHCKDGRTLRYAGRVLKPQLSGQGRLRVTLARSQPIPVHKLVLEAFIGPRPEGTECCRHLDDNPLNNTLTNLTWGTYGENSRDMVRNGGGNAGKVRCKRDHLFDEANTYVDKSGARHCRACGRIRWAAGAE